MADIIYPKGMRIFPPHEKAPDFIKGRLSIHLETFTQWAQQHVDEKGYLKFDLKEGREGLYAQLDTWKKQEREERHADIADDASRRGRSSIDYPTGYIDPDDIPF